MAAPIDLMRKCEMCGFFPPKESLPLCIKPSGFLLPSESHFYLTFILLSLLLPLHLFQTFLHSFSFQFVVY